GKPLMTISGFDGDAATFAADTFGIDINNLNLTLDSPTLNFFKMHNILLLAGEKTKAEMVESKAPTGKAEEVMHFIIDQLSRTSGIPTFYFGARVDADSAVVREQWENLKTQVQLKQKNMENVLTRLLNMAMVFYTKVSKNEETGETL